MFIGFCTMCMWVTMAYRRFLLVIDDNMRDLIELFRRPFSKMIPGTCLPVIDCLCRLNPGGETQQQVVCYCIDKRLVRPSYIVEALFSILLMLQRYPHF